MSHQTLGAGDGHADGTEQACQEENGESAREEQECPPAAEPDFGQRRLSQQGTAFWTGMRCQGGSDRHKQNAPDLLRPGTPHVS